MEDDDKRCARQARRIVDEARARLGAHVGEVSVHGNCVRGHEVELVDMPQPFARSINRSMR